ncbi:unnamed protein product [Closterium sp. NIES-65]|nr:unnamed protein product [Closterium sp. NIES-65]
MATPSVLTVDTKGRAVDFEVWVDDLQLFLLCDRADGLSLFDLTSGASPAPPATLDSTVCSQWATRDAAAHLAVHRHLPTTERVFPLPPSCPLLLLLLRPTSLVSTGSALRLPLAGDAALARARGAREVEGLAGAVEVVVGAVEGVGVVVGVVAGVVEVAEVAEVAEGAEAAEEAEELAVVAEGAEAAEVAEEVEVADAAEVAGVTTLRRGVGPVRGGGTGPCTYVLHTGDRADPGIEATALGAGEAAALGSSASAAPGASASDAPGASASAAPGAGESALSGATSAQALHTFTLDSGLYLPSFSTNLVAASRQVFTASSMFGPESAPCSCRLLSHETLLLHHRLGHPSLPRLRGMASRVLVSGLPRSLPPLPAGPGPTCVPCVEGRHRAAPHSSEIPPTEALLQTLHMDVWGPARVSGQGHERYFLLVVDDYSRYTTVFPLRSKGDVTEPRVSLPETSPTLRWTGKVGDASMFRVWGSRAFVRDLSADKLSPRAVPCVFLGFPPIAPG